MNNYYEVFDRLTSDGRVFELDLVEISPSRTSLTEIETVSQDLWRAKLREIRAYYVRRDIVHPEVSTWAILLEQRLVPPDLVPISQSA